MKFGTQFVENLWIEFYISSWLFWSQQHQKIELIPEILNMLCFEFHKEMAELKWKRTRNTKKDYSLPPVLKLMNLINKINF